MIIFSTKSIIKTCMAKKYETKRMMVARFLLRNIGYEVKKIYRGMKSIINLSTTRRKIASRPKRYNEVNKIQTESFREGIEIIQKEYGMSSTNKNVEPKREN